MSVAKFKELVPILPTSTADLAYVDPCRCECRCFYRPNDAEIKGRHGAYQGSRFSQSMSQTATAALHNNALLRNTISVTALYPLSHSMIWSNIVQEILHAPPFLALFTSTSPLLPLLEDFMPQRSMTLAPESPLLRR